MSQGGDMPMSAAGPGGQGPSPADLGQALEMAELVAHEINNLLNNILLNVAILDRKAPPDLRAELATIRQAGTQAGNLINRWQQITPRAPVQLQPVDFNPAVQAAVQAWTALVPAANVSVRFEPAPNLAPTLACPPDLERLVHSLLTTAAAAAPGGTIVVRTEHDRASVLLAVEDSGPPFDPNLLDRVFEPFVVARPTPGISDLQPAPDLGLAVCKRLARRQQGTITAANRPDGGVRVAAQFRAASR
jgi:signal transduction histidine kinase